MTWEPLPLDVAEWMGMDDDHVRIAAASRHRSDVLGDGSPPGPSQHVSLRRIWRRIIG